MRATLLSREPLCRRCRRLAAEIDHIVPVSKGGAFWDKGNLQALCRACHEAKTARENAGDLPTVCIHGWRSDLPDPCPDCPAESGPASLPRSRRSGGGSRRSRERAATGPGRPSGA